MRTSLTYASFFMYLLCPIFTFGSPPKTGQFQSPEIVSIGPFMQMFVFPLVFAWTTRTRIGSNRTGYGSSAGPMMQKLGPTNAFSSPL
jgi:hypothetical protein